MKKSLFLVLSLCLCFAFILTGCGGGAVISGGPDINAAVYGNGGLAVIKGGYVYFANSYETQSTVGVGGNAYGSTELSAIYRTKLNGQGLVDTDYNGMPVGAELLAPQIAGYEKGQIYIFGNYIYYMTPITQKDHSGTKQTGLYGFERVSLNGSGHQTLFEVTTVYSTFNFAFYQMGNYVYILYYNGTDVHSVAINMNSGSKTDRTIAIGVTSVAFPTETAFNTAYTNDFSTYIYYTRSTAKTDNVADGFFSQVISKAKIDGSSKADIWFVPSATKTTYTLKQVTNNRLYFEDSNNYIYSANAADGQQDFTVNATQYSVLTTADLTKYTVLADSHNIDMGIIALNKNSGSLLQYNGDISGTCIVDGSAAAVTDFKVDGEIVYYQTGGSTSTDLYMKANIFNTGTSVAGQDTDVVQNMNYVINSNPFWYVLTINNNAHYIFYLNTVAKSVGTNYYMNMVWVGQPTDPDSGKVLGQFIGVLDKSDNISATVKFNANGGTAGVTQITVLKGFAINIQVPVPVRAGYTFAGWYTAANSGAKVFADTGAPNTANTAYWADTNWNYTGNVTLYAHWTAD